MKNILVIGGAGYIGSHQVFLLCEQGCNVVVFDNLVTGFEESIDSRAKFVLGDLSDYDSINLCLKENKIDAIIHFAAFSQVGESVIKPLKYYQNNVIGMINLLQAMNENDIEKIIFSSSAAVYGNHEKMPIDETFQTIPTSPYGETKLMMEKIIDSVAKVTKIKYVSLRYFNVAGALLDGSIGESHNPETHLIPLVLQAASKNEEICIFGNDFETIDGTCIRDYIHVLDLCNAHIAALKYLEIEENESEIFNLGYGHGFSVLEIIDHCEKVVGHNIKRKVVNRRAGDPAVLVASNNKVLNTLDWVPEYDNIETIIESAYCWQQNFPNGFGRG